MKQQEINFDAKEARRLRDEGIQTAVDHANAVAPRWADRAYDFFVNRFLLNHNGPFMAEQFRSYCAEMDFDPPPNNRAFGGIFVRARHAGLIKCLKTQATRNPKSHRANAALWVQIKPSEQKKSIIS